jgi:hypothetical protein
MPGHSRPGQALRTGLAARILGYPQRAALSALMFLAVIVLERRIRKALRRDAGTDPKP